MVQITVPENRAKINPMKTSLVPMRIPATAKSLTSPPPIPPLLKNAIRANNRKIDPQPRMGSHHGSIGMIIRYPEKMMKKE
jgi:hypothetical protein